VGLPQPDAMPPTSGIGRHLAIFGYCPITHGSPPNLRDLIVPSISLTNWVTCGTSPMDSTCTPTPSSAKTCHSAFLGHAGVCLNRPEEPDVVLIVD